MDTNGTKLPTARPENVKPSVFGTVGSDIYLFRFVGTGSNTRVQQDARQVFESFGLESPPPEALPAEIENPFRDLGGAVRLCDR